MSGQDTEKVLLELDKDEQKAQEKNREVLQTLKNKRNNIGAKLDKLLSAYLDEIISVE